MKILNCGRRSDPQPVEAGVMMWIPRLMVLVWEIDAFTARRELSIPDLAEAKRMALIFFIEAFLSASIRT